MKDQIEDKKDLGIWTSTALVMGNMGWIATSLGSMLLALVFARLSRQVPGAGGPYIYTRVGFGNLAGFIVAWGYWISIMTGNAAIAVAFTGYLGYFVPEVSSTPAISAMTALGAIWFLTWINSQGVKSAGIVQLVTTVMKLIPIVALGTLGLFYLEFSHFSPWNLSDETNFSALTATAALTLWAFSGLESATIPADNVSNPDRTIPRATLLGTGLTALIYIASTVAVMGTVPSGELAVSTAPFADAANRIWGGWAGSVVAAGAVISSFGALNGWILLQGQIPMATARDGLFPRFLSKTSSRGTPVAGLVVSSVLVTLLVSMNYTRGFVDLFTFVALLAVVTTLLPYVFCSLAHLVITRREGYSLGKKGMFRVVLIAITAFLYSLWAIAGSGQEAVFWGFILILAGLPFYAWIRS